MSENKLPTIAEIEKGDISIQGKLNALNVLLNQNPPKSWQKQHPIAKSVVYIPIDKVEFLLTKIFITWFVEVKAVQVIANSAVVTIRLHYENPITLEMCWTDGVGAAPIHTKSGAGAMDWNAVQADSVMKAVPAAKSYAVKDAAECLGKIFGKDLNRKDTMAYDNLINDARFENAKITEK
jgi:hypothetical protein